MIYWKTANIQRSGNHASSLRSVQHELDVARDAAETARNHAQQSTRQSEDEVASWRDRCDGLEDELRRIEEENSTLRDQIANGGGGSVSLDHNSGAIYSYKQNQGLSELKTEIHSLVDELNTLSAKNEELMAEREQDAAGINEMEARVEDYRRKYDAVRIELRNLKGEHFLIEV